MIYEIELRWAAFGLGMTFILGGLWISMMAEEAKSFLKSFHRNEMLGVVLFLAAGGWFLWIVSFVDLMEYTPYRTILMLVFSGVIVLSIIYLRDFLSVRALGALLLLISQLLLDSSFLRQETLRLLIPLMAYVLIVFGMFFVGSPYLFRDGVSWLLADERRLKALAWSGVIVGLVYVILGFVLPLSS